MSEISAVNQEHEHHYYSSIISERVDPATRWEIGVPIKLADLKELDQFENDTIRPCTDNGWDDERIRTDAYRLWEGRVRLSRMITENLKRFYGRVIDIELLPLPVNQTVLADARKYQYIGKGGGGKAHFFDRMTRNPGVVNIFELTGQLDSSSQRASGILHIPYILFAPVPPNSHHSKTDSSNPTTRNLSSSGYSPLSRKVARPIDINRLQTEITEIREESIARAIQLQAKRVSNPLQAGSFTTK